MNTNFKVTDFTEENYLVRQALNQQIHAFDRNVLRRRQTLENPRPLPSFIKVWPASINRYADLYLKKWPHKNHLPQTKNSCVLTALVNAAEAAGMLCNQDDRKALLSYYKTVHPQELDWRYGMLKEYFPIKIIHVVNGEDPIEKIKELLKSGSVVSILEHPARPFRHAVAVLVHRSNPDRFLLEDSNAFEQNVARRSILGVITASILKQALSKTSLGYRFHHFDRSQPPNFPK